MVSLGCRGMEIRHSFACRRVPGPLHYRYVDISEQQAEPTRLRLGTSLPLIAQAVLDWHWVQIPFLSTISMFIMITISTCL